LILAALAAAPSPDALGLAEQAANTEGTKAEAEIASFQIAKALLSTDSTMAEASLERLAAGASNDGVRTNAQALLKQFKSGWLCAGPYRQAGKTSVELFDIPFAPELANGRDVTWRPAPGSVDLSRPGEVDLATIVDGDQCVVYLKTRVFVPIAQPVALAMGSDDGIKLWVNGELVHANNATRGLAPGQDHAKAKLRQGWNDILAKITQQNAGCGMILSIVAPDGSEVPGLRMDPRGEALVPGTTGFQRIQLSDLFYAEGAYYGDFNRDGIMDVVAGPFWFAGPDFKAKHEIRPPTVFNPRDYSDNFLTYTGDFNGDGWLDVFCVPFPGKEGYWFENPGTKEGHWPQHLAYPMVGNESPVWTDVNGDGRPDLVFNNEGTLGYATFDPARPDEVWKFHAVSPPNKRFQRFTHGVGAGDINGDGRPDVIEAAGWWEQPADGNSTATWKFHPHQFAEAASQMLVTDVDGDGLMDVINSWHCHLYGLVWYRQRRAADGEITWEQNVIMPPKPDLKSSDLRFSQLHSLSLVDMNGDGLPDIVTGKRFWAHGPAGDVEPNAPAVLYWFELRREGGKATFIPHLIDDDSGVGTQVTTVDLNGDHRPDVIVANKKGIYVHLNEPR
jgi:FG-GAP-like repeat